MNVLCAQSMILARLRIKMMEEDHPSIGEVTERMSCDGVKS